MDGPDMDRLRLDLADIPLPLAPAWPWIDLIVAFPNFMDAVRFGYAVALADKIVKKLVTPIAWPAPEAFRPIRAHCPDRQAIMIVMVAESAVAAFKSLLSRRHPTGSITFEQPSADAPGDVPLYEFTWNRTTLQVLKRDRGITYLQACAPPGACWTASPRSPARTCSRRRTGPATSRSMRTCSASSGAPIRMACSIPGKMRSFSS